MQSFINSLPTEDRLPFTLSKLYEQFGYSKYCMSKFEEYGFYSDNRDFLSTDGIIAFNNSAGKLMALKPDITLSIVKNARTKNNNTAKYYYTENVYRIDGATHDCKEIKQCGIEVLGDIDDYLTAETVMLALRSLECIDKDFSLVISHVAFVYSILEKANVDSNTKREILKYIKGKNRHDLINYCEKCNVGKEASERLLKLFDVCGELNVVLKSLKDLVCDERTQKAYNELLNLKISLEAMSISSKVRLDLSVLNHLDYYNGIILKGFVRNAPAPVLSGGRYDSLAAKIRGEGGAFGFAVYLDGLNLYYPNEKQYDCDVLIIKRSNDPAILKEIEKLSEQGVNIRVETHHPDGIRAKKTLIFENSTLKEITE